MKRTYMKALFLEGKGQFQGTERGSMKQGELGGNGTREGGEVGRGQRM